MAYLDNTTITVDAVLTKKGRERLGQGAGAFNITKFAVSDDEIDYSLYNTAHPLGTNYYSNIIESMPVLEAIPDESQTMRYKLTTLAIGLKRLPFMDGAGVDSDIILQSGGGTGKTSHPIAPETIVRSTSGTGRNTDFAGLDTTQGYTVILYDEEAAELDHGPQGALTAGATRYAAPITAGSLINFSSTVVLSGHNFVLTPKAVTAERNTKVTVFGNESGITKTFNVQVLAPTST